MNEDELYIEQIQIGPMQNFTYVVGSNATREVALVDPAWEIDGLLEHVQLKGYTVTAALITHYHPDHCGGGMGGKRIPGITELLERQGAKIYINKLEAEGLRRVRSLPSKVIVPLVIGCCPASASSRLVLPTPLRPNTQVTLPGFAVSETERSACAAP